MLNVLDNKKYTIKQQLREKQIDFMPTLRVFVTVLSFFECFLNIRGPAGYLSFFFCGREEAFAACRGSLQRMDSSDFGA